MSVFAQRVLSSGRGLGLGLVLALASGACSGTSKQAPPPKPSACSFSLVDVTRASDTQALRINEVMTGNDGAWVDEQGETDDFIELVNTGADPIQLADYYLGEKPNEASRLPELELGAGATVLLWADGDPEQGGLHLPFKLSASGTPVLLWAASCALVDLVEVPELPRSESFARLPDGSGDFSICRYATPEKENGETCQPPAPPNLTDNVGFEPYAWEAPFPAVPGPLVLSELALKPASFVEVLNASDSDVDLTDYALWLAVMAPGQAWPEATAGKLLAWPEGVTTLAAGERVVVPVTETDTEELALSPDFEGAVTLWKADAEAPADRLDFMAWPDGAALARVPDATGFPRFCTKPSPGASNPKCSQVAERPLPSGRAHRLETSSDFATLAAGGTEVGEDAVKFVVDMQAGDVVHLLDTRHWALHYSWIREMIEGEPHLDRCDPLQAREFDIGWGLFSQNEYFRVEGRRFLLGSLVQHTNGTKTVEFTPGDAIIGAQMRRAFFAVMKAVEDPTQWSIRPTEGRQINELRAIEGTAPLVGPNAPYVGLAYQPLNPAVGFGTLSVERIQRVRLLRGARHVDDRGVRLGQRRRAQIDKRRQCLGAAIDAIGLRHIGFAGDDDGQRRERGIGVEHRQDIAERVDAVPHRSVDVGVDAPVADILGVVIARSQPQRLHYVRRRKRVVIRGQVIDKDSHQNRYCSWMARPRR